MVKKKIKFLNIFFFSFSARSIKVSVISKRDVPEFGPRIRHPHIFKKDEKLKKFLLSKLINAEYASLRAPAFSFYSEKTLESSLQKLYENLILSTQAFINMFSFSPTSLAGLIPETSSPASVLPSASSSQISTTSSSNNTNTNNNKLTVRNAFRKFSTHYFKAENNPYLTADPASAPNKTRHSNNHDEDDDDYEYANRSKEINKKGKSVIQRSLVLFIMENLSILDNYRF